MVGEEKKVYDIGLLLQYVRATSWASYLGVCSTHLGRCTTHGTGQHLCTPLALFVLVDAGGIP
jgi:hypothetical protein